MYNQASRYQRACNKTGKAAKNKMDELKIHQLKRVNIIRFVLPFILFFIVASYEIWEHWVLKGIITFDFHLTYEVLFFGVFGPAAVFFVLSYIIKLLKKEIAVSTKLESLNRNLEEKVAQRTDALKLRNSELAHANEELKQLDRLKSDFVSLVSHELRGPLTTLNGGLEVALQNKDNLSPESRRTLEVIARESQRLTRFVQTILDVSRLEAGKFNMTPGPVAVLPILRRTIAVNCECDDHEVVLDIPEDLPPVWADEVYLEKIIANLLTNAVKYSPPSQPIELTASVADNELKITVADHGGGIPSAMQQKIFERFNRLESGDCIDTKGWGLGLYFVKTLTEAQDGKITVKSPIHDSQHAPGAAFTITLPITAEVPDHA